MPTVDFTKDELLNELDGRVRQIVRAELTAEREHTRAIVDNAIGDAKTELRGEMQQMKTELRSEMHEMKGELRDEMQKMRKTWDENYIAEVDRVTRIDKRIRRHVGDRSVHGS